MATAVTRRIWATVLTVALALGAVGAAPLPTFSAGGTVYPVSTQQEFQEAIDQEDDGSTIRLLNDIDLVGKWDMRVWGFTVTVDLNGHTLNGHGNPQSLMGAMNGGHLFLEGEGAFNVDGERGLYAMGDSSYTVSSIHATGSGFPINVIGEGSEVTVLGDATADWESGTLVGIVTRDGGSITIRGDLDGSIQCFDVGYVKVDGYVDPHGLVDQDIAVSSKKSSPYDNTRTIDIGGDVVGNVHATSGSRIKIGGDVHTSYNPLWHPNMGTYDSGFHVTGYSNGALVEVGGDVVGYGGPYVAQGGQVIVEGEILTTASYARVAESFKPNVPIVHLSKESFTAPTTKAGYRTYTTVEGAGTIWVRDADAPAPVAVTGITLDQEQLGLFVGETRLIKPEVQPANATNRDVSWSSSNPAVAQVDGDGLVTAIAPGSAEITATTWEGGFTASCTVDVDLRPDIPTVTPSALWLSVGDEQTLTIHMGGGEHQAWGASLTDYDEEIIGLSADTVEGTGPHTVSVTGRAEGATSISLGWSGGSRDGEFLSIPIQVEKESDGGTTGPGTSVPGGSGGGSSGGRSRSGSGKGGSSEADGATAAASLPGATNRSRNVNADGTVNSSMIQSELQQALRSAQGDTAVVTTRGAASISPTTLQAMADMAAAAGKTVILHADTLSADGRSVQGRLYVEPAKLTGLQKDLQLALYTENTKTAAVRRHFGKWYDNRLQVIHCSQTGSFGSDAQLAVKLDLSALDTDSLLFYSYNRQSNSYTPISNPAYSVDANGYLRLHTGQAGEIIVTDRPLQAK